MKINTYFCKAACACHFWDMKAKRPSQYSCNNVPSSLVENPTGPKTFFSHFDLRQTLLCISPTFSGVLFFMFLVLFSYLYRFPLRDASDLGKQAMLTVPFRLQPRALWAPGKQSGCVVVRAQLWPPPPCTCSQAPNNEWAWIKHCEMQTKLPLSWTARGKSFCCRLGLNKLSGTQVYGKQQEEILFY